MPLITFKVQIMRTIRLKLLLKMLLLCSATVYDGLLWYLWGQYEEIEQASIYRGTSTADVQMRTERLSNVKG